MHNPDRSMLDENAIFAGRYQIVRRLASGGMGAVYEARHIETGRACALKVMLAHVAENSTARERFRLEARAAAMVSSAHVVEVLDAGVDDATGSPFLVMELLRGEDLAGRVRRLGPHKAEEVAIFVFQASRGLDALHHASIVHRDLKPSNLFLAKRDETEIVKVLDLGVAKRVADTAQTTAVVGTPLYMAPEQMSNRKISAATDEYALAMVAYTLLVGKEYWATEAETATSSIAFALSTLDGPKELATERAAKVGVILPAAFDDWFCRAAAADPAARFPEILDAALSLCTALGVDSSKLRTELESRASASDSHLPRAPQFDAFASTMPKVADEKTHAKTITLIDGASAEIKPNTASLAKTNVDDRPRQKGRMILGKTAILLLGMAAMGLFFFRNSQKEKVVVAVPIVQAFNCLPAEIKGPGASPHLADALGKGACARLGIELGVSWLKPQGTPLSIHAEMHEDRSAHVVLEVANQKADGDGKTLIGATNEAIQKLAPLLRVPPMSPERIAGWGARDTAGALRIERAMRQKAFGFANPLEIAKQVVATDGDSPVSHAMLACALKYKDRPLAIKEKNEALQRLSQLPPKRAKLVQANLMDFIPTPDDPKKHPTILESYSDLGDDPDFASLFTMCGCVQAAASLAMTDWLAKHAPVMSLPILRCTIGMGEANRERSEQYMSWMNTVLPEWRGIYIRELVRLEKIDDARHDEEVLEWLGTELTTNADVAESKMLLAFGSFDAKTAVSITEQSMGEPDAKTDDERAIQYIRALLFAGKIRTGIEVTEQRTHFLQLAEKHEVLLDLVANQLRLMRLLQRPGPSASILERIDQALAKSTLAGRAQTDVELALLRARETTDKKSLAHPEAILDTLKDPSFPPDFKRAYSLPMVRLYHGNEAAAASYREISQVNAQQIAAFEAGLAFESIGAKTEAEKAYRLCLEEPWFYPFDAIAARVRLAEMAHTAGREEEARAINAIVDRAWADADPDIRDIVKRLK